MPDKLTDKEIVKAWEYCATKGNCSSCFLKAEEYCTNVLKRLTIDLFNRLQAENERFKQIIEDKGGLILTETAKAEAYKEFAERLKENFEPLNSPLLNNRIDNLLKELVGDK